MNQWLIILCATTWILPIFGKESATIAPPPFDADLFRRDEQVFSLHGEFLFWRVQEGALDYSLTTHNNAWGPSHCYAQGTFNNAAFNGDPGLRVTASFFRAPKFWEVKGQYTYLSGTGKDTSNSPNANGPFLTGTWPSIFALPIAKATSQIQMHYNLFDLFIARVFYTNPHFRLRLIGAGTIAWINQFWKILYSDVNEDLTKIGNRWTFVGGGLKAGVSFDWYWFTDIYMTGMTTFGTLIGSYHNTSRQMTTFRPNAFFNPSIPVRNAHFSDVRPAFFYQILLGPSYQKNFPNNRLEIFAGYELNTWLNLQEIFRSTSGTPLEAKETWLSSSMIALQGLTTRITVDF